MENTLQNHITIVQTKEKTLLYLNGNLIEGHIISLSLWSNDKSLALIVEETKPKISDWGWWD